MKTELKAKYVQHLINKKRDSDEGFTLIELLVVIIIIGILSAIALPSFLNQANKAKQSEAKTYVGSLNRGQQAYFTENSLFATTVGELGVGVATDTTNYTYGTNSGGSGSGASALSSGVPKAAVGNVLKGYAGGVVLEGTGDSLTSVAYLCESSVFGSAPTACSS